MDKYSLGIDFGTCSIKVSNYDGSRRRIMRLKIDKNDSNPDKRIPNLISYSGRDKFTVGERARKSRDFNGDHVIDLIKRKLEAESWNHEFKDLGFTLSACEIVQDIFSWLKENTELLGREIGKAVITVPVCFSEVQKERILSSARDAGIPVVDTLTEPVAALFALEELFAEECEENIVVFDFGGATLDLCLFHLKNDGEGAVNIDIEASCGMNFGGVDITQMIYKEIIYPRNKEYIDREISQDQLNRVEKEWLDTVEEMKMELFESEEDCVDGYYSSPNTGDVRELKLTLKEVTEKLDAMGIRERIQELLDELFEDSSMDKKDVTAVKTFGGTSRVRYFRELLEAYFRSDAFDMDDYDPETAYSAVADGAARYLSILEDGDSRIQITNSIPFYIGIDHNGYFKPQVKRNQKYGVMCPYRNIRRSDLEDSGWKLLLYQAFTADAVTVSGETGAVYVGSVLLDQRLYQDVEIILYKFGVNKKGKIVGQFFITDEENEISLAEEKEIVIGG